MTPEPIHSFEHPPIIETILGAQFKRLPNLKNPHLTLFWQALGQEWPNADEIPPLLPQYERFGKEYDWGPLGRINLQFSQDPSTRLRITNKNKDRMIQVQNGRFHYNWLKTENGDYPRYHVVREEFDRHFQAFRDFLTKNSLGEVVPDQWEVIYIDIMPKGTVWQNQDDWPKLFRAMPPLSKKLDFLAAENFLAGLVFEIKPQLGRLHVEINHGMTDRPAPEAKTEVIRMSLTARGPVKEGTQSLDEGIRMGRKAIVEAFFNLTSDEAHKYWGVTS